jgi:acetyl-CoA C-acetyltransferase
MDVPPHTPVIVGVGFHQEKNDDPTQCLEAYRSMVCAARAAAADAGPQALLAQLESVSVPQGMWGYRNPGRLVANALGSPSAKSILSDLGVLQLTLLSDLCQAIASGEQDIGLVTGGEARFRDLRSAITEQPVPATEEPEDTPSPDVHHTSSDPFASDLEARRGIAGPIELFAIIESALRHSQNLGVEEHRDQLAQLCSSFSEVAATNPNSWQREPLAADEIRNAAPRNAMQAFPYTKRHCSQWTVNRAVAILVCSAGKAARLGLDDTGWIYPVAAAQSRHVVTLAQQKTLHSHLGTVLCGERALALGRVSIDEVEAAELYSCFPSAIQSFARDLKIKDGCPLTVTGAMPFAGGPFNHFSLEGVARMVEVLRAKGSGGARRTGLVSNLSGIFGKQGCALFSNRPNDAGYGYADVTDEVAERDRPIPLNGDYLGPATVVGYTVLFNREVLRLGVAICDTPDGERTVVRTEDETLMKRMTQEEFCGRRIEVEADGAFSLTE